MKTYQCTLTIKYHVQAVDENDAVDMLADIIRYDWLNHLDDGELTVISDEEV